MSRGLAKKVHVNEIYQTAINGKGLPGPGHYSPRMLNDTPKFSLYKKDTMLECKHFSIMMILLEALGKSRDMPGPGQYKHNDMMGSLSPSKITSRVRTPQCNSIPKAENRFKLPSKS